MEVLVGRQRSFDRDHVLNQAMLLFWERGFEATSMADLSTAMGLKPPSIYAAFGNKEALFETCAEYYAQNIAAYAPRALAEEATTTQAVRRLLCNAIETFCADETPKGCLLVSGATNCSKAGAGAGAQDVLVGYRSATEALIADRIKRGIGDGDMPSDTDVDLLAKYISVLIQGLATQSRDGVASGALHQVAELALKQVNASS